MPAALVATELMWGEDLNRRSLAPHPTPWLKNKEWLTDADHFRIMNLASVASLR
jgi:hypothetical protein